MLAAIHTLTEEIIVDIKTHEIIQCSWCELYYNKITKEYVSNPKRICGHGICKECMGNAMNDLNEFQLTES